MNPTPEIVGIDRLGNAEIVIEFGDGTIALFNAQTLFAHVAEARILPDEEGQAGD
ncbi:MAG: hypothetical protein NVSMB52_06350 [Chloroflexota bacterium]